MGASDSVVEADPAEQVVSYRDQKHYRRHLWQPPHGELTEPAQAHLGAGPLDVVSRPVAAIRHFHYPRFCISRRSTGLADSLALGLGQVTLLAFLSSLGEWQISQRLFPPLFSFDRRSFPRRLFLAAHAG